MTWCGVVCYCHLGRHDTYTISVPRYAIRMQGNNGVALYTIVTIVTIVTIIITLYIKKIIKIWFTPSPEGVNKLYKSIPVVQGLDL